MLGPRAVALRGCGPRDARPLPSRQTGSGTAPAERRSLRAPRSASGGAQVTTVTAPPAAPPAPEQQQPVAVAAEAPPLAPPAPGPGPAPAPPSPLPPPLRPAAGMRLAAAAVCLPHPDKAHYGGEDAFFLSPAGGGALGVADGVGGWAESGVNPAAYSRTLMRVACAYIEGAEGDALQQAAAEGLRARGADASISSVSSLSSYDSSGDESSGGSFDAAAAAAIAALPGLAGGAGGGAYADPRAALDAAHRRTRVAGSATACVLQLDSGKRRLVAANLGDSGFMVVRRGRVVARSTPLQHYFDCPLQLGAYPEHVEVTDTAAQAELFEVPLEAGDVVVAGSDGLWDNTYEAEILERLPDCPAGVRGAAESIAALARQHASDPEFPSPYTREALQQGYDLSWFEKLKGIQLKDGKLVLPQLTGGKQDDITVLLAVVEDGGAGAGDPAAAA